MDARAVALSTFVHVCAAAALDRAFIVRPAARETHQANTTTTQAIEIEVPDVNVEVDAPKARFDGSLAGSDQAGALRTRSPREEAVFEATTDARFGMVALVESSRDVIAAGPDTTWAPRAKGGDGVGAAGLGIGAEHDGLGIGMGAVGTRGLAGDVQGAFATAPAWNNSGWHGDYTSYAHYGSRRVRTGPRIGHPARLSPIGPLDGVVIGRVVRGQTDVLLRCYRTALATHADLEGSLRVDFMIARDGSVIAAKDGGGSAGYDFALVTCMTKAFGAFAFPEAPATTRVAYAMDLHPR